MWSRVLRYVLYAEGVGQELTKPQPLDSKVLQKLESTIAKSQYVGAGRKLKVTSKVGIDRCSLGRLQTNFRQQVQPDIRGGLVVEIGDRTIDLSVAAKMAKMNKLLTDNL